MYPLRTGVKVQQYRDTEVHQKVPRVLIRKTIPAQWGLREWEQRGGKHQQAATLAVHSRSTHATYTLHSRDTHAQGHPVRKQHCHSL
jgi:hypothetical protein